jgi:hypothetical protein
MQQLASVASTHSHLHNAKPTMSVVNKHRIQQTSSIAASKQKHVRILLRRKMVRQANGRGISEGIEERAGPVAENVGHGLKRTTTVGSCEEEEKSKRRKRVNDMRADTFWGRGTQEQRDGEQRNGSCREN